MPSSNSLEDENARNTGESVRAMRVRGPARDGRSGEGRSPRSSGGRYQKTRSRSKERLEKGREDSLLYQAEIRRVMEENEATRVRRGQSEREQTRAQELRENIADTSSVAPPPLEKKKMTGPLFWVTLILALIKDLLGVIALIANVIPGLGIVFGFLTLPISLLIWAIFVFGFRVRGIMKRIVAPALTTILELFPILKVLPFETALVVFTRVVVNAPIKKRNKQKMKEWKKQQRKLQ